MKNDNKGFSLIELIVVIAIMAILVGVMAPNVLKYVESSRESADKQVADTVRTAVMTALVDPEVNDGPTLPSSKTDITSASGPYVVAASTPTKFSTVFTENLGMDAASAKAALKSKKYKGGTINVEITSSNEVIVHIDATSAHFNTKEGETTAAKTFVTAAPAT